MKMTLNTTMITMKDTKNGKEKQTNMMIRKIVQKMKTIKMTKTPMAIIKTITTIIATATVKNKCLTPMEI